jgi:hypothetical protein
MLGRWRFAAVPFSCPQPTFIVKRENTVMKFIALLIISALMLSACAPAALEVSRGPSPLGKASVIPVKAFVISGFDGALGPQLRQRLFTALENRKFVVLEPKANVNDGDFVISGTANTERSSSTTTMASPSGGIVFSSTSESVGVSGVLVRVSSKKDGQTVRLFDLNSWRRLTIAESVELLAEGIEREFKPAR